MDECSLCVIQDARWKYVHFAALPALLFDLVADPQQMRNLAEEPGHEGVGPGVCAADAELADAACGPDFDALPVEPAGAGVPD